jgi:hypothetical protein
LINDEKMLKIGKYCLEGGEGVSGVFIMEARRLVG